MSIATISSTSSTGYQSRFLHSYASNVNVPSVSDKTLLSPEQQNTVQQSVDAKITEQVENIKSNYQSAKDLDLTRAYYQQQQKLIDIYMQTSNSVETSNENTIKSSAIGTLTDTYAALYALHKNITDGNQQLPNIPDDATTLPMTQSEITQLKSVSETLPSASNTDSGKKQTELYNSLMMPSTTSYFHLSA